MSQNTNVGSFSSDSRVLSGVRSVGWSWAGWEAVAASLESALQADHVVENTPIQTFDGLDPLSTEYFETGFEPEGCSSWLEVGGGGADPSDVTFDFPDNLRFTDLA